MIIFNLFILLFSSALTMRKQSTVYYSRIVILTLCVSSIICYNNLYVTNLQNGIGLYGGIFNVNSITQSFSIFVLLISAIILIYNSFYHRTLIDDESISLKEIPKGNPFVALNNYIQSSLKKNRYNVIQNTVLDDNNDTFKMGIYRIIEYPLIILFIITGALFLMSSADLISIFISIELQSYGLYILSTLHRDSEQATWGGLTYFLLGGLSSCFILLGSALLYINSGTTSLDGIYIISTITDIIPNNIMLSNVYDYSYLNISLIILSVGFLFKVSAAPFHFWSPDVYDAIPTAVTTYVAIIAKISIFIFLLELVYFMNLDIFEFSWKNCLLISSLFSMVIGSVLGLTQFRLKKVYAYSTINHVGFILLALCVNNTESIQAYIFYIISYTISNLNAFIILVTIGYTLYLYIENKPDQSALGLNDKQDNFILSQSDNYVKFETSNNLNPTLLPKNVVSYNAMNNTSRYLKDIDNSPIQLVSQLKGYFYINSYLALSLAITLFSFIGIPPLIGFFAKQMVLSAALDNGYIFITLVGILTSVIGAVYYLNIVKHIFFYKSDYILNPYLNSFNYFGTLKSFKASASFPSENLTIYNNNNIKISSALSSIISILTLLLLLFIFIPNESFNLAKILSLLLFN